MVRTAAPPRPAVPTAAALSIALALAAGLALPTPARACEAAPRVTVGVAVPSFAVPPPWVAAVLPPPIASPRGPVSPYVYLAWMDANRAAYRARWGWNPWRMARYDAWYRAQRADLDARWTAPPTRMAWAPAPAHGRGKHDGRGRHDD